jgi:hypothetical protein
MIFKFQ